MGHDEYRHASYLRRKAHNDRDTYLPFDGDIYGQLLLVSFVHRIRGERKFESPEELAEQLREDEETVVALLQKDKENE